MKLEFTNNKNVSAIYFELLNSGYEYYSIERDEEHIRKLNSFRHIKKEASFFKSVYREDCDVYPYWPRASMLEHASFYVDVKNKSFSDHEAYKTAVMSADNISDAQRNSAFWLWLNDFPASLAAVLNSAEFNSYFHWECDWVKHQNNLRHAELGRLSDIIEFCASKYGTAIDTVLLLLNPIKCVYSADYYLFDGTFVFSSGKFSVESVVHEYLHHVVHPSVCKLKHRIIAHKTKYPGIDSSYYLDNADNGCVNAFEEYAVRQLTACLLNGERPESVESFLLKIEEAFQ